MTPEERLVELGCIICRRPAEIHHLRSGVGMGQRSKDMIPLCPEHHRLGNRGTAFHAGPRSFEERYGTESELLERVRRALEELDTKWGRQ